LILAGALLGFDDDKAKVFDIAIQTGAIFAVIMVCWKKIRSTLMALPMKTGAAVCAERAGGLCAGGGGGGTGPAVRQGLSMAGPNAVIRPEIKYVFRCGFGARPEQAAHASRLKAGALPEIEASGHHGRTGPYGRTITTCLI
jgi:hypothetical protein